MRAIDDVERFRGRSASKSEFDPLAGDGFNSANESDSKGRQDQIFRAAEVNEDEVVLLENFDEAGYLRLYPDVRRAIELGQIESGYAHYLWQGRAEGRALPGTPLEARNVMLASAHGTRRSASPSKDARCCVDELVIAPGSGMMLVGWIDDHARRLNCIRIIGPDWRVVIDGSRYLRVRRADVDKAIGGTCSHPFGFVGFIHFDQTVEVSGPIRIELWQEDDSSTVVQFDAVIVGDFELRDAVLARLAAASYFGNPAIESMSYLERGIGAELIRFNRSITRRIVAAPYVERFGPQQRVPKGTIVVCIYGKPEFLFLQNSLFSGLPGIEDYEFVYVSNSPELAETLLREARSCDLMYGLTVSVMILAGNAGFGAANNSAVKVARSDRLLMVNPDVFPRDREWARKHTELLDATPRSQTQIFGVPLYYDDGSLMHGGIYFEVDTGISLSSGKPVPIRICRTQHYGKGAPINATLFTRPGPVPAVSGAFISIDRAWFEQLGGFTEDFIFGHYEDVDLCLKSTSQGTAPWMHDIRMWHLEGKGSLRHPPHEGGAIVNRWLFSKKWMPMIDDGLTGQAPIHVLMQPSRASQSVVANHGPAKGGAGRPGRVTR